MPQDYGCLRDVKDHLVIVRDNPEPEGGVAIGRVAVDGSFVPALCFGREEAVRLRRLLGNYTKEDQ